MLKAVFRIDEKVVDEEIKDYFIASKSPLYLGIILPPSKGLWTYLKGSNSIVVEVNGLSSEFSIPYRIEVGENTLFFLRPESNESELLGSLEKPEEQKGRNVKRNR